MKSISLICLFSLILFCSYLNAEIITVKKDGTGQFTLIQEAIDASYDGDTILVWPGVYYENLHITDKKIMLASLNLTTEEEEYIYNTIIDGNQAGSCIRVENNEPGTTIYGFTIRNGSGYLKIIGSYIKYGGGVFIDSNSFLSIINCCIEKNHLIGHGGGILGFMYAQVYLSGTTVRNNHATGSGGGIAIAYESKFTFDSVNKCSVYLNYASRGNDLYKSSYYFHKVFLDTLTVIDPDTYYVSSIDNNGYETEGFDLTIEHGKINSVDDDLFVNPVFGADSNSGLSVNEPLKTIAMANTMIKVDSSRENSIYLAEGVYSDSTNGEKFPINIRPYIRYMGKGMNKTILDGEMKSMLAKGNNEVSNYRLSNMTIQRGTYVNYDDTFGNRPALIRSYLQNENILFDSVKFSLAHSHTSGNVFMLGSNNVRFSNCVFSETIGDAALRISAWDSYDTVWINNCIFKNNKPDMDNPDNQIGRGLTLSSGPAIITNSLFHNNDWSSYYADRSDTWFVNCTFNQNGYFQDSPSVVLDMANSNIYNSIFYEDGNYYGKITFYLFVSEPPNTTHLGLYNSLIEGGEEAIYIVPQDGNYCDYYYDSTNIDTVPLFYGGEEFPYNLSAESPCIDAGTLDLPSFIQLPEVDLAGNPRVFNGKIDMGAYEWNPTVDIKEVQPLKTDRKQLLTAAPNPFHSSTTITALVEQAGKMQIHIYNNSGLLVNVLFDGYSLPGKSMITWEGTDNRGQVLPNGVYHIVMIRAGDEVASFKVVRF